MKTNPNLLALLLGLAFLLFAGNACRPPTPEPLPAQEIVRRAAAHMQELPGFHFVIERNGAPAYLDEAETLAFRRAEGDYTAPDRARAAIRVIAPGLIAEVNILSIGEQYWETNLLTGQWQPYPPGTGFNPAVLFDPQQGFRPMLEQDLLALTLRGLEELEDLPGLSLYALQARLDGKRLYQTSYGMMGPGEMEATLWVHPETFDLQRLILVDTATDPVDPTTWQFDFWDFGVVAKIEPPASE